jgi:hypothetical protein
LVHVVPLFKSIDLGPLSVLLLCDVGEGGLDDSTPVLVHGELSGLGQDLVEHLHHLLPRPALEIFLKKSKNNGKKGKK